MLDRILIGSSAEPSDPNFENVTLLLHGDGSNGAQNNTFIDSSSNNFTITRNGNTTQGSFSPYGDNWSCYFDGTGDYLTQSSVNLGSGSFTVEMWVYLTSLPNGQNALFSCGTSDGSTNCIWYIDSSGILKFYTSGDQATASVAVSLNQWTHIAIVRNGSSLTQYINGTASGTGTTSRNFSSTPFQIMQGFGGITASPVGYVSNFRVVVGTAVYTSAFTPSTTPLTAITNTSLLTCAYNRFRDGSTNNFTITRNGDVKVTNFAPFAPSSAYSTTTNGGSAYFDGSDWLSLDDSSAWDFGTGDFTIELWVYPLTSGTATGHAYISNYAGSSSGWMLGLDSNGLRFSWGDTYVFSNSSTPTVGSWNHIAISRSGTSVRAFINGTQVGSTVTDSTNFTNSTGLRIGRLADGAYAIWYYNGYMSNARIAKTAVYTANFTPPSSPVTAITNTGLLLNATNAAIFDNSMKNDLETVGNAQISTSVKKFGTGSIYFDGTGDYVFMPNTQDLAFGTGNFTIELWAYIAGNSATNPEGNRNAAMASSINASSPTGIEFNLLGNGSTTGTGLSFANWVGGSQSLISASSSISQNAWHHFAVVRNGTTTTLYVDGTSIGSGTLGNQTINPALPLQIGQQAHASFPHAFNGYIDDFRITKGIARYTANFTPPTAPFPNK